MAIPPSISPSINTAFFNPDYHDLIGLIYDSVNNKDGFFPFLRRFVDVFDGHSSSFSIYDVKAQAILGAWVVNMPDEALEFYAEHISGKDILLEAAMRTREEKGSSFVATNLDLGDDAETLMLSTKSRAWLNTYGAAEAAGAITYQDGHYLNFFAIQRSPEQAIFTREQLAVFNLFLPHLNRAVELYTKMAELNAGYNHERLALHSVQRGIVVCDSSYKVVFKNAAAETIFNSDKGIQLHPGNILGFSDKEFGKRFSFQLIKAMKVSIESDNGEEIVMSYHNKKENITIVMAPLTSAEQEPGQSHRGGVMLNFYDWSVRPTINIEALQQFFQLTPAEAKISALLLQGLGGKEIAEQIQRSRETVKSQLQSIFRKTNTSRQSELVALLSTSTALMQ